MSLLYGVLVGLALGLTGGGGSIFAVPLLVFGLGQPVTGAIGLSLAVVGATAGFGAARHLLRRELDVRAGLVFAVGGMALAPLGTWIGRAVPGPWLLTGFALLMSYLAWRMWTGLAEEGGDPGPCTVRPGGGLGPGCYARLTGGGAVAGILSGLFGVGGGFIIVHGLMYVTGMALHRAVATSLLVIFLISIAGVASHVAHGLEFPPLLTGLFLAGGLAGMVAGQGLRARLGGPTLRRVFAAAMWAVAALLLARSLPALAARGPVETKPAEPPPGWEESAVRAQGQAVVTAAFNRLSSELMKALAAGGVSNALAVCSTQALPLTQAAGERLGVGLRRVAARNRNPHNAPAPDEAAVLADFAARLGRSEPPVPAVVTRADGTATFFAPILLSSPLCLQCHGTPGRELREADAELIRRLYPEDRATGFALGDLRGMWRVDFPAQSEAVGAR